MLPSYMKIYNTIALCMTLLALYLTILNTLNFHYQFQFYIFLCQAFFLVELLNIKTKKSNAMLLPTLLQLSSRLFISFLSVMYDLNHLYYNIMCFSWYLSDCIRYLYYIFRTKLFKFMRYNFFIVLYPLGTGIEIYFLNQVYFKHKHILRYIIGVITIIYLPGFVYLYWHMIRQRRKVNKNINQGKKRR